MSQHTCRHTWNGSDGLKENETDEPLSWGHPVRFGLVVPVTREQIHPPAGGLDHAVRYTVGPCLAITMDERLDAVQLLL